MGGGGEEKEKKEFSLAKNSHCKLCGVDLGPQHWWSFDQPCNLFDGAILVRVLCECYRIVELKSPTTMGVPRSKVCVRACMCILIVQF